MSCHCQHRPQTIASTAKDYSLEAAIVVRRSAEDDGLDKERLVAVALLIPPNDAEAPAAWVAPPQDNLMATV